jgi:hypothetical protein
MGKSSRLTSPFLQVRELNLSSSIYYEILQIFFCNICSLINDPLAAMSPVFLKMFESKMVEAGEGVLAVEDMSGESLEQLPKHFYTGSVDKLGDVKVDVLLQLLNASVKVL